MGVEYGLYGEVAAAMERNPGNAPSLSRFGASSIVEYCLWSLDLVLPVKELKGRIPGGLWENLEHRGQLYGKESLLLQGNTHSKAHREKDPLKRRGLKTEVGSLLEYWGSWGLGGVFLLNSAWPF